MNMGKLGRMGVTVLFIGAVIGLTSGCVSLADYNRAMRKKDAELKASEEHRAAQARALEKANSEKIALLEKLGKVEAENKQLSGQLEGEKAARDRWVKEIGKFHGIPGVTVTDVGLEILDEVLFDPGKAELKESGKEVLDQIAERLKNLPDALIRIEGHTDTDPIEKSAHLWKTRSNFELGAYRALMVLLHFQEQEINPAQMYLCSFGEYRPKDPANKAKNRRVIIGLVKTEAKGSTTPKRK